ncbi:MAG: hypothetical protein AMR96_05055 [Candidatus Adiutrix intracellularis]|jgi:heptosyltransferase-2|nr:MAG: hypothetical protein AMR96_05055 [Candidatus Adiutrix intracellularis]MDR2827264.1 lipopolysaccharide heptosyltransferase II [Candidatus Adiutrix intracellularis]
MTETKSQIKILVRGANWVGDAIMTLPALSVLTHHYPKANLTILSAPRSASIYQNQPGVTLVLTTHQVEKRSLSGYLRLARELAAYNFDLAVLFQNAFSAALLTSLARIPQRWGYARDGRSPLLTRAIKLKPADGYIHETFYYLNLLERLGLNAPYHPSNLKLSTQALTETETIFTEAGLSQCDSPLILAPGATFGPAKRWPKQNFAEAARLILLKRPTWTIILGSTAEEELARKLTHLLPKPVLNLAGRTSLDTAITVMKRGSLLLTNDSGLMHLGAALRVPLVALFGPTDPLTTAPLTPTSWILRSTATCAPCLRRVCPLKTQICFNELTPERVAATALALLNRMTTSPNRSPAVFIDPEGSLVERLSSRADPIPKLLPGAAEAVSALTQSGYQVLMAAPALTTVEPLSTQLHKLLLQTGAIHLTGFETPELDLSRSFWVGDNLNYLAAAESHGARSVLILNRQGLAEIKKPFFYPTLAVPNLSRAAEWITSQ